VGKKTIGNLEIH